MTSDSNWASVMYGSDASPAPVPAAKPAPAPAATTAVMHKPTAPASDWTATMHKVEESTEEPGPWAGASAEQPTADAAPVVVPEVYEFNLPEGVEIAPELDAELQKTLKEIKLPPDQAKKLVDLHVKTLQKQQTQFESTLQSWSDETMAILGSRADETFHFARQGLEHYDKQGSIREMLDRSGLGNRHEFIRLFEQIGRDLAGRK